MQREKNNQFTTALAIALLLLWLAGMAVGLVIS